MRRARSTRSRGALRTWPRGVEPVLPEQLRWSCSPREVEPALAQDEAAQAREEEMLLQQEPDPAARAKLLKRRRLSDRPPVSLAEVVGQERALEAIEAGLETEAPGFHLFVCAPSGCGGEAMVRAAVRELQPPLPRPRDRVYVANFDHPDRPCLLTLPRGKGRRFRRDLEDMLAVLRRSIPTALALESHVAKTERIRRRFDQQATRLIEDLAAELRPEGLIVGAIPEGFSTPELKIEASDDGEPLAKGTIERKLAEGTLSGSRQLKARLDAWPEARERLEEVSGEARGIARKGNLALRRLDARVAKAAAQGFCDDLAREYPTGPVRRWLDQLLEAIGERVELFLEQSRKDEEDERREADALAIFRANLFVDAKEVAARAGLPPVVFEPNPNYANLFGSLEPSEAPADHLRLRAGSLMQAGGGVLVLDAGELFQDGSAWRALKRAVKSGWLELQSSSSPTPGSSLRPQPIRSAFKLVALGSNDLYDAMVSYDPDFAQVFKVKVQLEDTVERSDETLTGVAAALLRTARRSGLAPLEAPALARLLEHSATLAQQSDRLALRFSELLDVVQEADRIAAGARPPKSRAKPRVRLRDVQEALERRRRRHDLLERRTQEDIDHGLVLIDTSGSRVGVVNGLVVYDSGDYVFSRPTRITAAVGVGRRGVLDIEREASFSGDTHKKGLEIAAGLLRERFAQDKPLCLTASVCFEQSYDIVDGDSASLAEVLAVLSALGDLPLRQGWGVTGSLNQKGEVQAVGGVTQKVEGFFDVCQARGLNGKQGVLIPAANLRDLMLREDVVEAVRKRRFHVAAVEHLDGALELLTGTPTGARPRLGEPYAEGTCGARVDARLSAFASAAQRFAQGPGDGD